MDKNLFLNTERTTTPTDSHKLIIGTGLVNAVTITWANLKAWLKAYFDILYAPLASFNILQSDVATNSSDISAKADYQQLPYDASNYISQISINVKYSSIIVSDEIRVLNSIVIISAMDSIINYGIMTKSGSTYTFGASLGTIDIQSGVHIYDIDLTLPVNTSMWIEDQVNRSVKNTRYGTPDGIITSAISTPNYTYTIGLELYDNAVISEGFGTSIYKGVSQKLLTDRLDLIETSIEVTINNMPYFTNLDVDYISESVDTMKPGLKGIDAFRIPTIEHNINGDILFFAESKYDGTSDFSACDIGMSVIRNSVVTNYTAVCQTSAAYPLFRYPCTLRIASRNYLFYNKTSALLSFIEPSVTNHICYKYSDNGGETWSDEIIIYTLGPDVVDFKFGIGGINAIKHSGGNIIVPMWGNIPQTWTGVDKTTMRAGIMVFNEATLGVSFKWLPIANADVKGTSEAAVVEMLNGDLLLDCRGLTAFRVVYISSDMGDTWTVSANSGYAAPITLIPIRRYGDKFVKTYSTSRHTNGLEIQTSVDAVTYTKVADVLNADIYHYGYSAISCYGDQICIGTELSDVALSFAKSTLVSIKDNPTIVNIIESLP